MNQDNNGSHYEPQAVILPDGWVYLEFPKSGGHFQGRRFLGTIVEGSFRTERDPEKHLLKVINAYGFNYALMKRGGFERVIVHTPAGPLETKRQVILDYGTFFHFKRKGFETQIFLRVSDFGREPKPRESPFPPVTALVSSQGDLFGEAA
jgi:hypothetical protein